MTDEEWQAELIIFDLIENEIVEVVGFDKHGEALVKPTRKFLETFRRSLDWDDGER
jgi:hypothetical protein